MWKNIIDRGTPQMKIWLIGIACWIPKAANTHTSVGLFRYNNGCMNASQYYVIRTFSVLLQINIFGVFFKISYECTCKIK